MPKEPVANLAQTRLLRDLKFLVCRSTDDKAREQAIDMAFELGISEGRVRGAQALVDDFKAAMPKESV
jgi:hypothetical protein